MIYVDFMKKNAYILCKKNFFHFFALRRDANTKYCIKRKKDLKFYFDNKHGLKQGRLEKRTVV